MPDSPPNISRRKFLKTAAAGGLALGAAWVAPTITTVHPQKAYAATTGVKQLQTTGPNLIANGSFETGVFGGSFSGSWANLGAGDNTSIANWTVLTTVEYFDGRSEAYNDSGILGFYRSISLNNGRTDGHIVSDAFSTTPGECYEIAFRMSGRVDADDTSQPPGGSVNPKTLDVLVNGSKLGSASYDVIANSTGWPAPMNYQRKVFQFVASSTSTAIGFQSTTNVTTGVPGGTTYGPMLDQVDVRLLV